MDVGKPKISPWTGNILVTPMYRPCRMVSRSSELPRREPAFGTQLVLHTSFALALIPLAVNGALSHFKPNQSTQAQRGWTMTWLALGIASDGVGHADMPIMLIYSAPAIGGLVMVCQMIMQYGNCVKLG